MDIYKRIVDGDPKVNWAIYKYNDSLTDLELCKSGLGRLSDLEGYWEETDILQGIIRVQTDKNFSKIVIVSFCGEGASLQKKAIIGQKYSEVERLFKGFKVHIQSRFASEVEESIIKAIGTNEYIEDDLSTHSYRAPGATHNDLGEGSDAHYKLGSANITHGFPAEPVTTLKDSKRSSVHIPLGEGSNLEPQGSPSSNFTIQSRMWHNHDVHPIRPNVTYARKPITTYHYRSEVDEDAKDQEGEEDDIWKIPSPSPPKIIASPTQQHAPAAQNAFAVEKEHPQTPNTAEDSFMEDPVKSPSTHQHIHSPTMITSSKIREAISIFEPAPCPSGKIKNLMKRFEQVEVMDNKLPNRAAGSPKFKAVTVKAQIVTPPKKVNQYQDNNAQQQQYKGYTTKISKNTTDTRLYRVFNPSDRLLDHPHTSESKKLTNDSDEISEENQSRKVYFSEIRSIFESSKPKKQESPLLLNDNIIHSNYSKSVPTPALVQQKPDVDYIEDLKRQSFSSLGTHERDCNTAYSTNENNKDDASSYFTNQNSVDDKYKTPIYYKAISDSGRLTPEPMKTHKVKVMYDYMKSKDNEISIFRDQVIDDVIMISNEWWYGSTDNEKGLFPSSYVELL